MGHSVDPVVQRPGRDGQSYPVIGGGVAPAPPGGQTTGKLYFGVVGDVPNSVVYNDGVQDLLVWVPGAGGGAPGDSGITGSTGTSEIIGGAPTDDGQVTGGDDFAPAVDAAPVQINPYETPEQHNRGH